MKTNINKLCHAVLTEYGAKVWNAQYERTPAPYKPEPKQSGDTLQAPLWELMQVFGPGLYHGMTDDKLPFEGNVIDISEFLGSLLGSVK